MVTYLEIMFVRMGVLDCLTFHWLGLSDHKLVCARMALDARSRMAGHRKFNVSLLDREDFRLQLTKLVQQKLVGAVAGNEW